MSEGESGGVAISETVKASDGDSYVASLLRMTEDL
jgi:hypothetical protein